MRAVAGFRERAVAWHTSNKVVAALSRPTPGVREVLLGLAELDQAAMHGVDAEAGKKV
jgi:hypothetical protein